MFVLKFFMKNWKFLYAVVYCVPVETVRSSLVRIEQAQGPGARGHCRRTKVQDRRIRWNIAIGWLERHSKWKL